MHIAARALCLAALATASSWADVSPEWINALDLTIEGQGWPRAEMASPYARLPLSASGEVREQIWNMGQSSTGLCVRFSTDSSMISVRWSVWSAQLGIEAMPASGFSGVELYTRDGEDWRWISTGCPSAQTWEAALMSGAPAGVHDYRLYLPLYNRVESLEIGVSPEATTTPAPADSRPPIVFYGTSITAGGCTARPGMAYPAILGRRLGRPAVNLGFPGNAFMEPELAGLVAQVDASAYVLAAAENMEPELIRERWAEFARTIRRAHPAAPIVMVEHIEYEGAWFNSGIRAIIADKNAAIREACETLRAEGMENIVLVPGDGLIGHDGNATVDGVHPTQLGFVRMADGLEPVLRPLVE
jgi:hypothetical protein